MDYFLLSVLIYFGFTTKEQRAEYKSAKQKLKYETQKQKYLDKIISQKRF